MATILAVASGKGGVGKTFITAALSSLLARNGYRVLAADADMGLRNLDLFFGKQDDVLYDMGDVIKKKCRLQDAVLSVAENLDFVAASQKHTWDKIDAATYQYLLEKLTDTYDFAVIDCPPGRGRAYRQAVAIADRIFFVVEPTWSSMRDTARLMQFCHKHKQFHYDVVFNNFYRHDPGYVPVEEMISLLNPEHIAGILPHDPVVHEAALHGVIQTVPAEAPLFRALTATMQYLTAGTDIPEAELVALLPEQEIRLASDGSADTDVRPNEDNHNDAQLNRLKEAAAAELQKAAAVWSGQAEPPAQEREYPAERARLSLRKRRHESRAWRYYRR